MAEITEQSPQDEVIVAVTKINEQQRTIRWSVVSLSTVACVWLISDAVVKIATDPKPAWLTLALAIVTPIVAGGYPTYRVVKWARKNIKKYTKRTIELEKIVDKSRTSSDLREDGTLPHD